MENLTELLADREILAARIVWAKGELYWETLIDLDNIDKAIAALTAAQEA